MNSLIAPSKELGYSNIYLDFLNGSKSARSFYPAGSLEDVAKNLDNINYPRDTMAEILKKQNLSFGASDEVFSNIEKLKEKRCLTVFSGQQAGIFGGPMLVIIKALAIVKAAKLYEQKLNRPVIPIFWIAGDDHDFEEVNHTYILNQKSELIKLCYGANPEIEYSTAELTFCNEEEINRVKAELKEMLGTTDFTKDIYEIIDKAYTTKDSYVTSFGKLMSALTSKYGLILFSPGDKEVKQIAKPLMKDILNSQDKLHEFLSETNQKIQSNGYHIQVEKKDNSTHLFYNCKGRKPVLQNGDNFTVGEDLFTKEDLLKCIEDHPERFSPDVMTRPILQSYLFPVLSQKGGAAEIAYLAQINKLFSLFNLAAPFYKGRPTLSLIEKRFEKLINEHDIKFNEITGDIEQLINRILAKSFPHDIEERFNKLKDSIEQDFKQFTDSTLAFDTALEGFAKQSFGKIDFTLKAFEGKVFSSHKKKSQQTRDKIYRLWNSIYPNRNFQERSLNVSYFISKYGLCFIDFLYEAIDCEQNAHQLIHLTECEN